MLGNLSRAHYGDILRSKGFKFDKTQQGFPSRGEEDVYSHPDFKCKFYVTRVRKAEKNLYGFYAGSRNGKTLDKLQKRNASDDFRNDTSLEMWVDEAFHALMKHF